MSRRWSRALTVVALLCAFVVMPAVAQAWDTDEAARPVTPARTWVIEVLERLWSGLIGIWEEEGVSLDPDGTPKPTSGSPTGPSAGGDEGISLDPDG